MQFSLLHLVLVFPAYALAVFLGMLADSGLRISYRYFGAVNGVRGVRLSILGSEEFRDGQRIPDDVLDRWLAGSGLSKVEQMNHRLYEYPELDPWRRPYRFIRDTRLPDGQFVDVGVFSLGRDGITRTNGDDPDDINSWDKHSSDIYRREIIAYDRWHYAIRGAYLTPFVYVGLVGIIWLFKRSRRSQPTTHGGNVPSP